MGANEGTLEPKPIEPEELDDIETRDTEFDLGKGFQANELTGGLKLGGLESEYEQLFAEALEDGVITAEERARLDKAADNLGLNPQRMNQLEQAMIQLYEADHRVKVVERWEDAPQSLALRADGDGGNAMLLKQIEKLQSRVKELEEELREARAHVNVEIDLSGFDEEPVEQEDIEALRRRARRNPGNPDAHARLFSAFKSQADADGQYCAAQALVALGAATEEHTACYEKNKRKTLITPSAGVSQEGWAQLLTHPEQEALTGQILGVIAPAVLLGRVSALRREKKLHQPDPETKQDGATSTLTAVRAVGWGATILGLPTPTVYIEKDRDAGFVHVPGMPPYTVLGKRVLSGRTQLEHAFLIGRHMTLYRQEHFVKTLFSAVLDLEDLFLAALLIGSPALPIGEQMKRRVEPISKALAPMLEAPQLDALRSYFMRFVEDGGRTNLMRWSEAVDKTACRAGLLLCDDLPTAIKLLDSDPGDPGPLKLDLVSFIVSERYSNLRKMLGIALE